MGWPFPVLKYKYIFQTKYTEAIFTNSTRKLLWFEISKMLIAVKNKFIVLFIIISGTLSFPIKQCSVRLCKIALIGNCLILRVQWADYVVLLLYLSVFHIYIRDQAATE